MLRIQTENDRTGLSHFLLARAVLFNIHASVACEPFVKALYFIYTAVYPYRDYGFLEKTFNTRKIHSNNFI